MLPLSIKLAAHIFLQTCSRPHPFSAHHVQRPVVKQLPGKTEVSERLKFEEALSNSQIMMHELLELRDIVFEIGSDEFH